MDATRLIDPAFWSDPQPLALGDSEVTAWGSREPALARHILFQTSGSTGTPKWVALSKQALLLSAATVNRHLGVDVDSCWGLSLPLHHVGGFGVAARSYEAACRMVRYGGKWDPASFTTWVEGKEVTHVSLVPTQVHDLVTGGCRGPSSLKVIVVGGGRLALSLGQAARDLGWPVLASYGMTETGSQVATQSPAALELPYRPEPLPLLDPWTVRTDDEQRLSVKGPVLFTGTVSVDAGHCLWAPRVEEWYATGDRASVLGRNLTPLGRVDQLVKILGELVDPEAIERDLVALSGDTLLPASFAIVAIPDARGGHRLVPVIERDSDALGFQRIVDFYNLQAPGFRRLSPHSIIESLPLTELGKVRRPELARRLQQ